jgi:flagellum-specific ATP synthase
MPSIVSKRHLKNMQNIISKIALHEEYQDIVAMGLYTKGSNPDLDRTMQIMPRINSILQQDMDELTSFETTIKQMESIGNEIQKPAKNGTSSQGARG